MILRTSNELDIQRKMKAKINTMETLRKFIMIMDRVETQETADWETSAALARNIVQNWETIHEFITVITCK